MLPKECLFLSGAIDILSVCMLYLKTCILIIMLVIFAFRIIWLCLNIQNLTTVSLFTPYWIHFLLRLPDLYWKKFYVLPIKLAFILKFKKEHYYQTFSTNWFLSEPEHSHILSNVNGISSMILNTIREQVIFQKFKMANVMLSIKNRVYFLSAS